MAGVALVRVDTTVCAVSAATGLGCLLNDDVFDDEVALLDVLCLCVRLGVLQQAEDELDRLLRPAT